MPKGTRSCETCDNWEPNRLRPARGFIEPSSRPKEGVCRALSPRIGTYYAAQWPETHKEDWCAEYKPVTGGGTP